MAFMSLTGWAADLDASKFVVGNHEYGSATALSISSTAYTVTTDYTADLTKFYTDETLSTQAKNGTGIAYTLTTLPVGKYYVKVTGAGTYAGETAAVSFKVYGIAITIDFVAGKSKQYGETDPTFDASYYTLKQGASDFANTDGDNTNVLGLTIGRAEGEAVGNYDYTFAITNKNYTLTKASDDTDQFAITAKTVTAKITLGTEVLKYTGENQTPTILVSAGSTTLVKGTDYTLSFTKDDGTGNFVATTTTSAIGSYKATATLKGNYTGAAVTSAAFPILPADLSVYVNNYDKEYDGTGAIPNDITFAFSGLVGEDAGKAKPFPADGGGNEPFVVNYATGGAHTAIGSYNLSISQNGAWTESANYSNYNVTFLTNGKLNVVAKKITVKPVDATKSFSDDDPEFTVDASEAIAADQANVALAYKVTRTNASVEAVGSYEGVLTLTKKTDEELGDDKAAVNAALEHYDITLEAGDFTITEGALTVYPKNVTITYGDEIPTFEVVAINGSGTAITLTKTPTVKYKEAKYNTEAPKKVGTYVLVLEGDAAAAGYETITKLEGQLTINKKELTVKPKAQTLHVDDMVSALDKDKVSYDGLVEGDVIGYKLGFNTAGTGSISTTYFKDGDATKAILSTADGMTFDKGISIAFIASTETDPNDNANYIINAEAQYGALTIGGATSVNFLSEDDDWTELSKFGTDAVAEVVTWKPARSQAIGKFDGTWKAEQWNTMILPFDIKVRDLSSALGYAIVNVVDPSKTETGNVAFKLVLSGTIKANTPIAVKTDDDIAAAATIYFGEQTLVKPESETVSVDAGAGHKFVGVYKTVKIDKTTPNYHFLVNGGWKHIGASSSNKYNILPFNCYIDQSNAAGARELTFTFEEADGSTTAIRAIEASANDSAAKTGWYTIGGVKLQGVPTQKGIYIKDGKKVVIK